MTSSLVGSEMCIRDSPEDVSVFLKSNASPKNVMMLALGDESPRGSRQTVSYTHLTLPTICSV
eukprot:2853759-Prorocentrum_lima.AAC.1